jgi:hypothetical protein
MIIENIRVEEHAGYCQLTARLRRESSKGEDAELWFRYPNHLRPFLVAEADPFLCAALLPAMVAEKRLLIEGDISPRLLQATDQIQDIYGMWVPGARHIPLEIGVRSKSAPQSAQGIGTFFSGGVDSFHTLLKRLESITHLILIDLFDSKMLNSTAVSGKTRTYVERVAANVGKQLVVAATNVRSLFVPTVCWSTYHGAALAAVGLGLRRAFQTVYVPASYTYTQLHPWGSHPLLDPLWSTESTRLVHDGAETTRIVKTIDWICPSDLALQALRVCLKPDDEYNCGRCEKCLRTMIGLYLGGALERCSVLPHTLSVRQVAETEYLTETKLTFAYENRARLRAKPNRTPFDRELQYALDTAILRGQEKLDQARRLERLKPRTLAARIRRFLRQ